MLTGPHDLGQGGALREDTAQVRRHADEQLIGGRPRRPPHPTRIHDHPFVWSNEHRDKRARQRRPDPTLRKPKQLRCQRRRAAAPRHPRRAEPLCLPRPIPVGPRFKSTCHAGATSPLTTPTSAPRVRPADSPAPWVPVGSVTLGTIATAVLVVRSVRPLRATPRSPTPVPLSVRP